MGWGLPEGQKEEDRVCREAGGRVLASHPGGSETQGEEATLWGWGHILIR